MSELGNMLFDMGVAINRSNQAVVNACRKLKTVYQERIRCPECGEWLKEKNDGLICNNGCIIEIQYKQGGG